MSPPKRETALALWRLAVGVLLVGCGPPSDTDASASDSAFRVALITPGSIADRSWNGGAYAGLLQIRDSLGAQISHIQSKTPAEFDENFRLYGADKYALVIGHGYEFQDAARRVAPAFPNTVYLITSGSAFQSPNVAGIRFAFDEPSYLAGFVAGSVTRSKLLGCIGGTELPPVRESFEAFAEGARAANPDVRVITSYVGNWDDVSAGQEQALAQIARGVDVIFQNADAAGLGVFQAARQSGRALVFGSNADQNGIAPEVTLGSVVIDIPRAFLLVARHVKQGTFSPRVYDLHVATGAVKLVLNPTRIETLPRAVRFAVDSIAASMSSNPPSASREPSPR